MNGNERNELSDRDLRDLAAGKVLDWLSEGDSRFLDWDPALAEPVRLLAEHAQRESSLDRMVEAFEERYRNRPVAPPVVSIGEVDRMASRLEGHRTAPIPAGEVEAGGAMLMLLAGELIAQDRRLASKDTLLARLPELMGVAAEAASLFREYQAHHEAEARDNRDRAQAAEDSRYAESCHETANGRERKADRNRQMADRIETVLFGCPRSPEDRTVENAIKDAIETGVVAGMRGVADAHARQLSGSGLPEGAGQ